MSPTSRVTAPVEMSDLHLDGNGIWITGRKTAVAYPEGGNDASLNWEAESFWFSHRNNVILQAIRMFPFSGIFVDIGGGNGYQSQFLAENVEHRKFVFVEPGYQGCLNARRRGLTEVFNVEPGEFPFSRFKVGAVGLFDVLEHINDDVGFLKEIAGRCAGGTRIYITVPAYNWLWSDADDYAVHFRRYTRVMLQDLAAKCGLTVLYNAYFFGFLVPLVFLVRALPYRIKRCNDTATILKREAAAHKPGKIFTYCLDRLANLELRYPRAVAPCGASCIAVFET